MAQVAQSLYDALRRENLVVVRKTEQDYRFPLLFGLRLILHTIWADVIHL